jgi:hypothetical protein
MVPLMGLAPAPLQRRWEREVGFPAVLATAITAAAEVGVGAVGLVQALAAGIGGAVFLPPSLMWLTVVGPVLMAVGLVRLVSALAHSEPLGSPLGVFWLLVSGREEGVAEDHVKPKVHRREDDGGLQVKSPIHRADWTIDGVLGHRGDHFVLSGCTREGEGWVYHFEPAEAGELRPTLKMRPPRSPQLAAPDRPPKILRSTVTTVVACLAPADAQRIWADRLGVRAVWLTLIGGAAEILGGLHNLKSYGGDHSAVTLMLNVLFVCDGSIRLALLALYQGPVGSVFGIVLRPLIRRLIR